MRACRAAGARASARARESARLHLPPPPVAPHRRYARAIDGALRKSHEIVSRKAFSLAKLALLPRVVAAHPRAALAALPLALAVDAAKAGLVARMTASVEALETRLRLVRARRERVEAHDARHHELATRATPRGGRLARAAWRALAADARDVELRKDALNRARQFVRWLCVRALFARSRSLFASSSAHKHTHTHRLSLAAIGAMCSAPGSR